MYVCVCVLFADIRSAGLGGWKDREHLKLLYLKYDVTPASFVDVVVSDVGMVRVSFLHSKHQIVRN